MPGSNPFSRAKLGVRHEQGLWRYLSPRRRLRSWLEAATRLNGRGVLGLLATSRADWHSIDRRRIEHARIEHRMLIAGMLLTEALRPLAAGCSPVYTPYRHSRLYDWCIWRPAPGMYACVCTPMHAFSPMPRPSLIVSFPRHIPSFTHAIQYGMPASSLRISLLSYPFSRIPVLSHAHSLTDHTPSLFIHPLSHRDPLSHRPLSLIDPLSHTPSLS